MHGLVSNPVQGISITQRTLLHCGMSEQFAPPCTVKLTFPLELEHVSRSRYLLETPHGSLIAFLLHIASQVGDFTGRLARMAVKIATKEPVDCACLVAISNYTEAGHFGQPVLAIVATVHYFTPSVSFICISHINAFFP